MLRLIHLQGQMHWWGFSTGNIHLSSFAWSLSRKTASVSFHLSFRKMSGKRVLEVHKMSQLFLFDLWSWVFFSKGNQILLDFSIRKNSITFVFPGYSGSYEVDVRWCRRSWPLVLHPRKLGNSLICQWALFRFWLHITDVWCTTHYIIFPGITHLDMGCVLAC